ncbi:MAG: PfkB family carbohydrate kinase [Deltaproteobacteria bacterium]|nr:PfkB family carbohydrate kinase [Deltaproteobacteria bacterium]
MSLLVVGSMAIDNLKSPAGHRPEVIGGAATFSSTTAAFFHPVRVVSVIGADFPEEPLAELGKRGIDCSGVERTEGESFRWTGEYGEDFGDAKTIDTKLGVLATFDPVLPESFRDSRFVFLANNDPDIQGKIIDQLEDPELIALDTMNFWIEGKREALLKTIARVDLLLVNDTEARMLSGEKNIVKAAAAIQKLGPQIVIIKRGEFGAMLFVGDAKPFFVPAMPLTDVVDPTGAGDSFAGGLTGYLAGKGKVDAETLRQAMVAGSALASFAVQGFGLDRLWEASREELQERLEGFVELTRFEPLPH